MPDDMVVERVARALQHKATERGYSISPLVRHLAVAAIEAMREPTEAMIEASNRWQPIETAPKDATAILVMRDIWPGNDTGRATECNGHNTYVAAWWETGWMCYMGRVTEPRCPIEPTHWQPLPDPPIKER